MYVINKFKYEMRRLSREDQEFEEMEKQEEINDTR